jgi:hypothetical protein
MGPNFRGKLLSVISKKNVKEGNHCPRTSQQSGPGLLTRVSIDYYPLHPKYCPFLFSEWTSATLSLKKSAEEAWRQRQRWARVRGQAADDPAHQGSRRTGTRSGAATGFARVPARWQRRGRRRWVPERGQAAVEWTQPETRVLDWILSDSDEGPSSGKEERVGEGVAKWARGLPHVCEHKCLATMKRCLGSSEEGVEDLISDSGNDYDDGEASLILWISLPFYLFYRWSLR